MNPTGSESECPSLKQIILQMLNPQEQLEAGDLVNYFEKVTKRIDLQGQYIFYMQIKELMNPAVSKGPSTSRAGLKKIMDEVERSQDKLDAWAEDFKNVIEQIDLRAQAEKPKEPKKEPHVTEGHACEENEEVKFNNWAKVRGLGLTKIRMDNTICMLRDQKQKVSGYKKTVADILSLDIAHGRTDTQLMMKKILEELGPPELPDDMKLKLGLTEKNKNSFPPDAKLSNSPELLGPSSLAKSNDFSLAARSLSCIFSALRKDERLQWQKPKQAEKKKEISPKKLVDMVNKEVMPKPRARLLQKKKESGKKPDLDQGTALNLSTSISPDKFFFDLSDAALPITGGFSFGSPNNTSSDPMTKSNSNDESRSTPFRFSASAGGASLGPSGSLVLQQKLRCLFHNKVEELLFIIQANLYRLTDGDWIMCGPGHVKIWRHNETKKLRVSMQQNQLLKVCFNHLLTADVVYRPMDRKSWIFAAYDSIGGKSVLERFILRFKDRIAAQEFISAVRSALNGTAQAIKN